MTRAKAKETLHIGLLCLFNTEIFKKEHSLSYHNQGFVNISKDTVT